jgi:hypothetical protein
LRVATKQEEKHEKSWNETKIAVTLQQQKKKTTKVNNNKSKNKISINNLKLRKETSYGKNSSCNEN